MDNKDKKKRNNTNKVIIILTSLFITSTIGSLTGTYAWFEYSARARMAYHGTAISEHKILEVGLYSETKLDKAEEYNLYEDPLNPGIYWSSSALPQETVWYFLKETGYSTNTLTATTSGGFIEGDDFSLKPAPKTFTIYNPDAKAMRIDYVHLPLRFRTREGLSLGDGNTAIVLNDVKVNFEGNAQEGARVHFGSDTANFIFNPTSRENGFTNVGGPLDLNNDGFYDYYSSNMKEFLYGQAEEDKLFYSEDKSTNKEPMDEDQRSVFNSAHAYNTYALDTEKTVFKKAQYFGIEDTLLKKELTRMSPLNKVASLDLDIYVEGWSDAVIEQNANNQFSLDLTFEVQEI